MTRLSLNGVNSVNQRTTWMGVALLVGSLNSQLGRADQFHYNNVILGERAVGMGGAYAAVADDASGAYYNPAGLAFALSNDISGSANALYDKKIVYKKAFANQDYTEYSGGTFAPFFGVLQKLEKQLPGLVGAFAYYTTDTELKDQNDFFVNKMQSATLSVDRLHRTVQQRASTTNLTVAGGYRIAPSISIGFGLNYATVSELTQDYQDVEQSLNNSEGAKIQKTILNQNVRQNLTAYGVEPVLGVQVAVGSMFSVGMTLRKGAYVSQKLNLDSERTTASYANGGQPITETTAPSVTRSIGENALDKPLGTFPGEARFGMAWFASTRFLWTADVSYHEAAKSADNLGSRPLYERNAVINYSTGAEYYVMPALPLRLGLFTNHDARPALQESSSDVNCANSRAANYDPGSKFCNQPDHVDYFGESLFLAWVSPNSQIALGGVLQQGKGKAQKVGASKEVQTVVASSYTIGFSATHSF